MRSRSFILGCLVGLIFTTFFYGCRPKAAAEPAQCETIPNNTKVLRVTSGGNSVFLLEQLDLNYPDAVMELLGLVDTVKVDADARVPIIAAQTGPPPGWVVIILQTGAFPTENSPTGFATGLAVFAARTIYVAVKLCSGVEDEPLVPALGHEYAHAWAWHLGLPDLAYCIGHKDTPCNTTQSYSVLTASPWPREASTGIPPSFSVSPAPPFPVRTSK